MKRAILLIIAAILLLTSAARADELDKQRCPKPTRFALVFSFGYAGDLMPKDDAKFEELLVKIKDAGFNTIHCTYTEKRLDLCKKHGILAMIDLLAPEHHVYKSPDKSQAICEKLKNHPAVWGYNIWNDPVRKTTPGRVRDIRNVRTWDPTHPAFSGTYRTDGMRGLDNPDIFGYYDFHWKRGLGQHFPHLLAYSTWAKERNAWFYSWLSATSGQPGKGNFNRSLWSANTAIACGQKGIIWFLATDMMNQKTLAWTEIGKDIAKVHAEITPLAGELPKLGNPRAIYATTVTKSPNNDALPKEAMPAGLDQHALPADFWARRISGEFVVGVYQEMKVDYLYIANHNAYAEQSVALKLSRPVGAEIFNRQTRKWQPLEMEANTVRFSLSAAGGELLRIAKSP